MTKNFKTQADAFESLAKTFNCASELSNLGNTVVLDEKNDTLRQYLSHMHQSMADALRIESARAQADFIYNVESIINRYVNDINNHINANINELIKTKDML